VSLIIGTTLAFLFLDSPWRWIVIVALVAVEGFEVVLWLRLRRMRSLTGPEGIVGSRGRALSDCDPEGQVRVKGQIWKATCPAGAAAGDDVVVEASEGLRLKVSRAAARPRISP
jgi:membrane-bound serine protease (ClpP class)